MMNIDFTVILMYLIFPILVELVAFIITKIEIHIKKKLFADFLHDVGHSPFSHIFYFD